MTATTNEKSQREIIDNIAQGSSQLRMALAWADEQLGEENLVEGNQDCSQLTYKDGDTVFRVTFELTGSPKDRWIISDDKNEVLDQTTDYGYSCKIGEDIATGKRDEKEERDEASTALSARLTELMRNNGGPKFLFDVLASATITEVNSKGDKEPVLIPERVYGKLWKKEFRPLIKRDSTQSEERQFSNIVLRWFQKNVLRGLHPESNTKERIAGMVFAYSRGHGYHAPQQYIGIRLQKQEAAAKEIPGLAAVLAMVN